MKCLHCNYSNKYPAKGNEHEDSGIYGDFYTTVVSRPSEGTILMDAINLYVCPLCGKAFIDENFRR